MKARISRLKITRDRIPSLWSRVFRVVGSSRNASGEERFVTILITARKGTVVTQGVINTHGKLNMFMHSLTSRICCFVSVGLPL